MLLKKATKEELEKIEKIYKEAFPKEEQAPFEIIKKKFNKGKREILSIYEDKKMVGFFITAPTNKLAYLTYFAIDGNIRGKGYGSEAIKLLKEKYKGKNIFLDLESIKQKDVLNSKQRIKRKEFYKRQGFKETNLSMTENGVLLEFMCKEEFELQKKDITQLIKEKYGFFEGIIFNLIIKRNKRQ